MCSYSLLRMLGDFFCQNYYNLLYTLFYETHHIYPISPAEIVRDMKETKFKDPIFCHPEDYKFVSDGDDFLVLGCIVRLLNG